MWLSYALRIKSNQNVLMALLLSAVIVSLDASASKTRPDSSNSIVDPFQMDKDRLASITDGRLMSNRSDYDISQQDKQLDLQNNRLMNSTNDPEWTDQVDWSAVWPYFNTGCLQWLPLNHVYFQLANGFLFLSYLAPAGLYGLIYLRLTLAIGSAFLSIWGWTIICAFDTFLWNAFFFLINAVHALVLLFSLRPLAFDDQVEQVYKIIFRPLKMSKQQFRKVAECIKSIQMLKRGEYFAVEQETSVDTLSLLLSGTALVIDKGRTLYAVSAMQFLDSAEWFDVSSSDLFQVSVQACEESRVLLWHRHKLQSMLRKDAFLQSVFHQILGHDVVRKLSEASRNTKIVKSKGYPEVNLVNNGVYIENGKSNNRKPSVISVVCAERENARDASRLESSEQLSLLNETIAKTVPYRSNAKRP
uniref:Popeye domain containing protein n=1 Tax=Daphnia magna TaxID=35525 RepID=A0A0N8BWS7_9CRUS